MNQFTKPQFQTFCSTGTHLIPIQKYITNKKFSIFSSKLIPFVTEKTEHLQECRNGSFMSFLAHPKFQNQNFSTQNGNSEIPKQLKKNPEI